MCRAQELRNAALPLQNLLGFMHLHEAREGLSLPVIWEKGVATSAWLTAGITRIEP